MTDFDAFELELAAGIRSFVAAAPTEIDARGLAHAVATQYPRPPAWRVFVFGGQRRYAWLTVVALLVLALALGVIVGRRPPHPLSQGLIAVVRDGGVYLIDPEHDDNAVTKVPADREFALGGWWPDRAWSPDGTRLALVAEEVVYLFDPASAELAVAPAATGFPWRFNGWAPGGRAIVLHDAQAGVTRIVDLATGSTQDNEPPGDRTGLLCSALLSPNGESLAALDQGHHVFLYSIASATWIRFDGALRPPYGCADSDAAYNAPEWAPDSRSIVFVGDAALVVVNADGSGRREVGSRDAEWSRPSWSSDGLWISYLREDGIYLVHPDGSDDHQIVAGGVDPASIEWSPDSAHIEFLRPSAQGSSGGRWWTVDIRTLEMSPVPGTTMELGGEAFARQPGGP